MNATLSCKLLPTTFVLTVLLLPALHPYCSTGRRAFDFRSTKLTFGSKPGHVEVELGTSPAKGCSRLLMRIVYRSDARIRSSLR
jgi:hypothetical protein